MPGFGGTTNTDRINR